MQQDPDGKHRRVYLLELVELSFEACQQVLICAASLHNRHTLLDSWQIELLIQAAKSCIANSPELDLCRKAKLCGLGSIWTTKLHSAC